MSKVITYTSFAIASALIVLGFVTAKSYAQLAVAVVLYPALTFFAFKIFQRKGKHTHEIVIHMPKLTKKPAEFRGAKRVETVVDVDKRTFLKLIGATGITVFLASLLGKRAESILFERGLLGTGGTSSDDFSGTSTQPISGYRISEVDESGATAYYGFINKDGGWLIMRDETTTSSFRYAKGDFRFPENWKDRENLKYDYFYNLF